MALSGTATPGQSGPESDANERVPHIPQSSNITGTSPSDSLFSYPGHSSRVGYYPSAEVLSVYSTDPSPSRLGNQWAQGTEIWRVQQQNG